MTWFADSNNQTAATATHVEHVTFVELDFPSGYVRLHTRTGTIRWGTESPIPSWLGVGKLGTIDGAREDAELRPNSLTLSLSGVDSALITSVLTEAWHGRAVTVYDGFLDTSTFTLVGTPERRFSGIMDSSTISLDQNAGIITLSCESELARWSRPRDMLYTPESQKALGYTTDRFFDLVAYMPDRVVDWSKKYSPGYLVQRVSRSIAGSST